MLTRWSPVPLVVSIVLVACLAALASPRAPPPDLTKDDEGEPDQAGGPTLTWSLPSMATPMRPLHIGYALVASTSPLQLADGGALRVTMKQSNLTLFDSAHLQESDGLGSFLLQAMSGGALTLTGTLAGQEPVVGTVDGLDGPAIPGGAGNKLNLHLTHDPITGKLSVEKDHGGARVFVEVRDRQGHLLVSTWVTSQTDSTANTDVTLTVDPTLGDLEARAILAGRLGMGYAEAPMPRGQAGLPLPGTSDLDLPDLGTCNELLRFEPASPNRTWQKGTSIHVSFADAHAIDNPRERGIQYTLNRQISQNPRLVYSWDSSDPWARSVFSAPAAGVYAFTATELHQGTNRRCQATLTFLEGPTGTGTLAIEGTVGAEASKRRDNRVGTLDVRFVPNPATTPYSYETRVMKVGSTPQEAGKARLVWAGKLYGQGSVEFHLGGLLAGRYQVHTYPSPQTSDGVALSSTGAKGFVATFNVTATSPESPTPTEEPHRGSPGFAALGVVVAAIVVVGFLRRR